MSKAEISVRYSLNVGAVKKIKSANKALRIFKAKKEAVKYSLSFRNIVWTNLFGEWS